MKKIIIFFKQMFCKHTLVPSIQVGYETCLDCRKMKLKDKK